MKSSEDRLTAVDYKALADFRHALRKFLDFSTSAAQREGVPPQQHQALLAIKGVGEREVLTIGALAERLLIAPHTATELVGRLVSGGYLTRETDSADRRRQTLHLTPFAEEVLQKLSSAHLHEIRELAPHLIQILNHFRPS